MEKTPKYYGWFTIKGWALVALAFGAVFGGIGLLIQSEYVENVKLAIAMDWVGGILLVSFFALVAIWFATSSNRK